MGNAASTSSTMVTWYLMMVNHWVPPLLVEHSSNISPTYSCLLEKKPTYHHHFHHFSFPAQVNWQKATPGPLMCQQQALSQVAERFATNDFDKHDSEPVCWDAEPFPLGTEAHTHCGGQNLPQCVVNIAMKPVAWSVHCSAQVGVDQNQVSQLPPINPDLEGHSLTQGWPKMTHLHVVEPCWGSVPWSPKVASHRCAASSVREVQQTISLRGAADLGFISWLHGCGLSIDMTELCHQPWSALRWMVQLIFRISHR